jgi:hypothetical protein
MRWARTTMLWIGGLPGVLNLDVIESAIGRPYTGYYPKIWQKAGALAQSVAGNHGFTDGNKRTALYLALSRSWERTLECLLGITSARLHGFVAG